MKILIVLILGLFIFSCTNKTKDSSYHLKKAQDFYNQNNYFQSLQQIDSALQLDQTNVQCLIFKSKILSRTNNFKQSIDVLKKSLKIDTSNDSLNYLIGNCYFAFAEYEKYIKNDDWESNNLYDNALFFYDKVLSRNSKLANVYIEKSIVLLAKNKNEESLTNCNNALLIYPDKKELSVLKTISNIRLSNLKYNSTDFELDKQKSTNSINEHINFIAAETLAINGDYHHSIEILSKLISQNPQTIKNYLLRAYCYNVNDISWDNTYACKDYKKAIELGSLRAIEISKDICH